MRPTEQQNLCHEQQPHCSLWNHNRRHGSHSHSHTWLVLSSFCLHYPYFGTHTTPSPFCAATEDEVATDEGDMDWAVFVPTTTGGDKIFAGVAGQNTVSSLFLLWIAWILANFIPLRQIHRPTHLRLEYDMLAQWAELNVADFTVTQYPLPDLGPFPLEYVLFTLSICSSCRLLTPRPWIFLFCFVLCFQRRRQPCSDSHRRRSIQDRSAKCPWPSWLRRRQQRHCLQHLLLLLG